jgi:diguanylate cyclase (GGDEF)-like protein
MWSFVMKILDSKYFYIFTFIVLSVFFLNILEYFESRNINDFLTNKTQEAKKRYHSVIKSPQERSDFIFRYLINTKSVIDIFKKAHRSDNKQKIRDDLYLLLKDRYKELKAYNIQQLHFHLPNNDSFLRFHRPKKFGDNLTSIRDTVAYVNKNLKSISGFEEGRIFNGYRFVYPLFDEYKNHVGSVEISHSLKAFKNTFLNNFSDIKLYTMLSKEVVKQKVFDSELKNYEVGIISEDFFHQKSLGIDQHILSPLKKLNNDTIKKRLKSFDSFSVYVKNGDKHYDVVSFIPIKNGVNKNNVGYIVSIENSDFIMYTKKDYLKKLSINILLALLITIIMYIGYKYYKEMRKDAYYDYLTKIYKRSFFEKHLDSICNANNTNESFSLIMFDIDHFKSVNDTYGHDVGDEVLKKVVEIAKSNIRKTDIIARWGGEEFMILVESNLEEAKTIAEHLRKKIEIDTKNLEGLPAITCSFGVVYLKKIDKLNLAYKTVDQNLYKAKDSGRNIVVSS